jgi:hypothetical protein
MDEDILSDVVPSNIVSRQASQERSNLLGENSHGFSLAKERMAKASSTMNLWKRTN